MNYDITYTVRAPGPKIFKERELVELLIKEFDPIQEHFTVIGLDNAGAICIQKDVFLGGLGEVHVEPRVVFRYLLLAGAATFIVAHNHIGADLLPSHGDISVTKRLKECGKIIGIKLLDHIIYNESKGFSFSEKEMMGEM